MLIIMDMDFTLVDTTEPEKLRRWGRYAEASSRLRDTTVYPGVREMLSDLESDGHEILVLTNSRGRDARELIEIHGLGIKEAYYYKDLGVRPKPHPGGHETLLRQNGVIGSMAVSVGDKTSDREAAHRAGIRFIAAMWGSADVSVSEGADGVAGRPSDVVEIIGGW